MLKVLYDYQIFQMQNFGGISRYFFELIKNSKDVGFQEELSLLLSSNEYLFEADKSSVIHVPLKRYLDFYRITNQVNRQYSQLKIKRNNFDVLHPTFFEDYFIGKTKKPYVITVYDLINEKFPQYFQKNDEFAQKRKRLLENASRIIAISENTKDDIVNYLKIDPSKIDVTYLAESLSAINSSTVEHLPDRYLLFIGKRGGYKNFENMYQAVKSLLQSDPLLSLVCAGGSEFSQIERDQFKADKVEHQVKFVAFSRNEELKFLYEKAICFIFPSLYEGFGIPVLESFASGCVACISNSSSLKEIGKKAALLFDPNSVEEIKNSVINAISLDEKNKFVEEGFNELKKYSWKKTAEQTFDIYKKC